VLKLIQFLDKKEDLKTQIESSRILSQLCSTEKNVCKIINQSTATPDLIAALDLENQVFLENVLSTINSLLNEAKNNTQDRKTKKIYLQKNCLKKVCAIFEKHPIPPIKKNIITFLFNIVKQKPNPSLEELKPALPILKEAIQGMESGETLVEAVECIGKIANIGEEFIQEVIDLGVVPFLIQHLYNPNEEIYFPSLRALGNIITGNDEQTEVVLSHPNFLIRLFEFISSPFHKIQKEACWVISNIAAGLASHKMQIIKGPNYMNILKNSLSHGNEEVSREVTWIYMNLGDNTSEAVKILIEEHEYLECLSMIFSNKDKNHRIRQYELEALSNILSHGEEVPIQKIIDFIQKDFAEKIKDFPKNAECQEQVDKINKKLKDLGFEGIELKLSNEEPNSRKARVKKCAVEDDSDDDDKEEKNSSEKASDEENNGQDDDGIDD